MKSSHFAAGLVGLSLVGLWYFAGGANPLPTTQAADAPPRVAAPLAHENLSVYLVFGPDAVPETKLMSLQEALERDLAVVHETSNVNTLSIENRSSEYELFVQSGDIVKGGKQDRMVQFDMLLPPGSGAVPMPAHCVEQSRWTGRGSEDAKKFASSYRCAAGKELKLANYYGQQQAVWDNVRQNQGKLNDNLKASVNAAASPTSFQLTLESDALLAKVAEYETALKSAPYDRGNVIGVVFAVNGRVTTAEVYGSNALFRKAWPKLLFAGAAEAVMERDTPVAAAPSAREVEKFLAYGAVEEAADGDPFKTEVLGEEIVQTQARLVTAGGAVNGERIRQFAGARGGAVNADVQLNEPAAAQRLVRDQQNLARQTDNTAGAIPNEVRVQSGQGTRAPNDNVIMGGSGAAQVNNDGNRLNSNRNENRDALMVESRDQTRGNAVFHRSYIKK